MALKYTIVSKKNPLEPNSDPKFYAVAKSNSKVSVKDICKRISERSSYSKGELEGAINEFLLEAENVLREGNIAQLGDLGNFRLSIRTRVGATTEEKFSKANIKDSKVIFWPGASLRKLCQSMDYELHKPKVVPEEPETPIE